MMKKFFAILVTLFIIAVALEVNNIIPTNIVSNLLLVHDYLKANPYILAFVTNVRTFISSIDMHTFLNSVDEFILTSIIFVQSLPWEKINIWYVLLVIFIIGVITEKFRVLNNEIKFLNQKITKIKSSLIEDEPKNDKPVENKSNENLVILANEISASLKEIKDVASFLRSTQLRSKKLRRENEERVSANSSTISIQNDNTPKNNSKDEIIEEKNDNQNLDASNNNFSDSMDEQDISSVDLARTYLEANENEKAEQAIKHAISTGTEEEKHEARLLYMQLRK
tara:strand:+ start:1805 stop:2650 length:846 start_codon:yes stop_codon:yes gene_type:complete